MSDSPRRPAAVIAPVVALMAAGLGWVAWRGAVDVPADRATGGEDIAWRVDLNTATAAELELLPGIGEGLAARIVADRAANGPFAGLDDVTRIPGIGDRTAEAIRPYAIASGPDPTPNPPPAKPE